jgi:hypothetical protein
MYTPLFFKGTVCILQPTSLIIYSYIVSKPWLTNRLIPIADVGNVGEVRGIFRRLVLFISTTILIFELKSAAHPIHQILLTPIQQTSRHLDKNQEKRPTIVACPHLQSG